LPVSETLIENLPPDFLIWADFTGPRSPFASCT
jgi:hypothetical protein